ncbi:uncharacterized protein H6S33_009230 [Morchella sextelata]|uniref:uncharacterized protein n=1 Tax=Morchella sextelata TaxID=1174677 RepID=UPI001D053C9E|nr:uncharacterized protein H6S33_009230 [Morchella sextelata]KAH0612850.1 hypothetical protein H6S33_009230 [Morchella sextelata]
MKLFWSILAFAVAVAAQTAWPISSTNYTDAVQWDHYSLIVKGERLVVWSGEFHYWRIPVPHLWRDVLEKMKAHGFNTFSIYGHWGYHSAAEGVLDFENTAHNPRPILELAEELGMYVIFRPGPYVNAESHSGGHAQWVTTGAYGSLRNNDTRFVEAYTPYMDTYEKLLEPYQVQNGGNLILMQIENEFSSQRIGDCKTCPPNLVNIDYMEKLEAQARKNGIYIPLTHNNPNTYVKGWSTDYDPRGAVDISGVDTYPYCWSCVLSECGGRYPYTVAYYYDYFLETAKNQPAYLPEFQGGSYNPWGGPQGGCISEQNSEFVNIMYRHNIGERITIINIYVFFGGTNWGNIGYPLSGTSYDYAAAISESRDIGEKFWEGKALGLFIDVARDLAQTERVYAGIELTSSPNVNCSLMENPETLSRFYVLRHSTSNATTEDNFTVSMTTSEGDLTVPQYGAATLWGLAAKILVSDFPFGKFSLLYSTAEILTASIVDNEPTLVLWVPNGEQAEFVVKGYKAKNKKEVLQTCDGCSINFHADKAGVMIINFHQEAGISVVQFDGFKVVMVDRGVAWKTWVPKLNKDPLAGLDKNLIVHGPRLVRKAVISKNELQLSGDTSDETELLVHAPKNIKSLTWNGKKISKFSRSKAGILTATLAGPKLTEKDVLSQLNSGSWKYKDSLPEVFPEYDDSKWIVANKTASPNPTKPAYFPVLYADDYGFFHGYVLYRGRFSATNGTTGVYMNLQFGTAGGYSAWLNGRFVGSWTGSMASAGNSTWTFPAGAVKADKENVLVILMDHNGKDQFAAALNYRGIYDISLKGSQPAIFTKWTIQGNAGGTDNIDPVRGPYNEGGITAERAGWHMNGFDSSKWAETKSMTVPNATVTFFRKEVKFSIPEGYDVPVQIRIGSPAGQKLRVQLWVNGYQYGKYMPQVGNQIDYPVPPGVLNYNGKNTFAVSVWNVQDDSPVSVEYEWSVIGIYESSFSSRFDSDEIRPAYNKKRLGYL